MIATKLTASKRQIPTPTINQLRGEGKIPAELYGTGQKNQHLFLNKTEFEKVYQTAGETSLIDLVIDKSSPVKVMVHELQRDPVSDKIKHIDLYQVRMDKELTVAVPLVFIGESKAVKEMGGTLITSLNEVEISCLPNDLISQIEVDVTVLQTFDEVIRVGNLKVPEAIKILTAVDSTVATVVPPELEKEPAPAEAEEVAEGKEAVEGEAEKPAEGKEKPAGEAEKKEESKT